MSRRGVLRILVAVGVISVVAVAFLLWTNLKGKVTEQTFLRVRPGMSLAEVEQLFGGPGEGVVFREDPTHPGHCLLVPDCPSRMWYPTDMALDPASTWRVWRGYEVLWVIRFKDGVVDERVGAGDPGFMTRVRAWVRW